MIRTCSNEKYNGVSASSPRHHRYNRYSVAAFIILPFSAGIRVFQLNELPYLGSVLKAFFPVLYFWPGGILAGHKHHESVSSRGDFLLLD